MTDSPNTVGGLSEPDGVRSILDSEHPACLEMLGRAFKDDGGCYFVRYFKGDPYYKNDYCRVYVKDGQIVSSLHICKREVRVGCARLVMGGIANVGTDPDHRGKGYSSQVLRDSARVMDAEEMDFSVLYTGINDFYDRLGWRTVPVPYLAGKLKKPVMTADEERCEVKPYEPADAPALLQVYDEFSGAMLMSALRDESLWHSFTMHKFHPPWRIMLAKDGAEMVAYTISIVQKGRLAFSELGFTPGRDAALSLLMKQAAEEALAQGVTEVKLEPATHPAVTGIASGIAESLETCPQPHGMFMFFDVKRTFGRLLPELKRRVKEVGLAGSVAIKTEAGESALVSDGSAIELAAPSSRFDQADITQADLTRLIFGFGPIQDEASTMPDRARAFLDRLFPPQPFVYWETDKF